MNNKSIFPDKTVEMYIHSLGKEFDMEFISLTSEQKKFETSDGTYEDWEYTFRKKGSLTSMKITVTFPQGFIGISFNSEAEKKQSIPNHFFFEPYLSQILNAHDEINKINEISRNKTWKENWRLPLEILKIHLRTDLKDVINGKMWPVVYFDWADYVEPEALDRIYEDQVAKLKESEESKWVTFLDYFRKNKR
jgi:hypothetical protein